MPDEAAATQQTEETVTTETKTEEVKNPDAVLAKNKELLGKLAEEKKGREELSARLSEFERKEAERERARLEKKGEWETLRDNLEASHKTALESEQTRYTALFQNSARFELAVELGKHKVVEGEAERLAKLLLLDEIKSVDENGKVVWRKIATDEEVKLDEFIPSLKAAYGNYFEAENNPGSNAPGNNGKVPAAGQKRSAMNRTEKAAYITKHGSEAYNKLPL